MHKILLQFLVLAMSAHFGQLHLSQNIHLQRQDTLPHRILASIKSLPSNLKALSINNQSDILFRDRKSGNLAILSHSKLYSIPVNSIGGCAMNDHREVLVTNMASGGGIVWDRGHSYALRLPAGSWKARSSIDDAGEILVEDFTDDIGFYKNGKVTLLCHGQWIHSAVANYMNDKHQVVGLIQEPDASLSRDRLKPIYTSRPFLWDNGKLRYLQYPGRGFCYPTMINNNGQIVGEYRPEHDNLRRYAVIWMRPTSPMTNMNTLLGSKKSWHLSANVCCNDKLQIISYGQKSGRDCNYLCSISPMSIRDR